MRPWGLQRKLVVGVLVIFLIPAAAAGGAVAILYRSGVFEDNPRTLVVTAVVGLIAMMVYVGSVAHAVGRSLVRNLQEIALGAELLATVNPDHRLAVRTGDELEALAEEVNRLADHLRDARQGLERGVARATREVEIERRKLSAVLETLGEGVVVTTPDGRVTLANAAAQALLGAGSTSLLGRSLFDFVDQEKVTHFLDRLTVAGASAARFSLRPAGGAVLETVMTPFLDGEQRTTGFVLVLRDVTHPARSEAERQRALAEVQRDLRGPLSSIRSLAESLLGAPGVDSGTVRRLLGAIHAEALRLSEVVKAIGEAGPLGLARPPWHFEEMAVADLMAMTLRRLAPEGGGPYTTEVDGPVSSLPRVRAEASALSAALARMLSTVSACRVGDRPAWLRPRRRDGLLQIEAGAEGAALVADLERFLDVPLPAGVAERLTVRDIVRQHAGEVWAYADGLRCGFRMTLPASEGRRTALAAAEGDLAWSARFVGAGTASGQSQGEEAGPRPDFYDFSLHEQMERHVLPADRERPLDELTCVVLDTETTGLHRDEGDRVVSLAGVKVRNGAVRRGETFDALVNPGRPIPAASARLHGITDAAVAEAPPIDVVLPAFLRFAEGAVLVGHQVWFDLRFLTAEAERSGLAPLSLAHPVLDTLQLSEVVHGPLHGHGLDAAAKRLGVVVRGRHSALGDALTTAEVFVRLVELLKKRGIRTLGQAIDAARQSRRRGAIHTTAGPQE